jgi:hypothetical protein
MAESAEEMRNRLLAQFPDIAAGLDKLETLPERPRVGQTGPKRPSGGKLVKTVKPCKGVAAYKAYNWGAVAQKRAKPTYLDKPGLVVSKGRKRPKRR